MFHAGMSFNGKDNMVFIPRGVTAENEGSSLLVLNRKFSAIPEFDYRRALVKFETTDDWSNFRIMFQISRKPQGPLLRVAFPGFLLTLITVSTFGFDLDDEFGERIAYLVTLILTFVAFNFVSILLTMEA